MVATKSQVLNKFMNKDRHMRHGKVALNLLRYDVEWVVRRWGYMGNEALLDYFKYIVSLFEEDLRNSKEKTKITKPKKQEQKDEVVSD